MFKSCTVLNKTWKAYISGKSLHTSCHQCTRLCPRSWSSAALRAASTMLAIRLKSKAAVGWGCKWQWTCYNEFQSQFSKIHPVELGPHLMKIFWIQSTGILPVKSQDNFIRISMMKSIDICPAMTGTHSINKSLKKTIETWNLELGPHSSKNSSMQSIRIRPLEAGAPFNKISFGICPVNQA